MNLDLQKLKCIQRKAKKSIKAYVRESLYQQAVKDKRRMFLVEPSPTLPFGQNRQGRLKHRHKVTKEGFPLLKSLRCTDMLIDVFRLCLMSHRVIYKHRFAVTPTIRRVAYSLWQITQPLSKRWRSRFLGQAICRAFVELRLGHPVSGALSIGVAVSLV